MPWLALDDTDTRAGGCTTEVAFRIARDIHRAASGPLAGLSLSEPARLVRLNPAIPVKTRGNGAVVLPLGASEPSVDKERFGGGPDHRSLFRSTCYAGTTPAHLSSEMLEALAALVDRHVPAAATTRHAPAAALDDPQPGVLVGHTKPDGELYRSAVARPVSLDEVRVHLARSDASTLRAGRGVTGALAAAAWPARRYTYELTLYRDPRVARAEVLPAGYGTMLRVEPSLFDCGAAGAVERTIPNTPCPVLAGIRGRDPTVLLGLLEAIAEAIEAEGRHGFRGGWVLRTNHATNDHARFAVEIGHPHAVVRGLAKITGRPIDRRGGHVFVQAETAAGACMMVAFEPTKGLRRTVRRLVPGDVVEVLGRTGPAGAAGWPVHLEAFRWVHPTPGGTIGPNPRCARCGRAMKSRGRDAGFRCPSCGKRAASSSKRTERQAAPVPRGVWFRVDDATRGHLLGPAGGVGRVKAWGRHGSDSVDVEVPDLGPSDPEPNDLAHLRGDASALHVVASRRHD